MSTTGRTRRRLDRALAEVTAERDRLREELDRVLDDGVAVVLSKAEVVLELEKTRHALRTYGQHKRDCSRYRTQTLAGCEYFTGDECDCGFSDATEVKPG